MSIPFFKEEQKFKQWWIWLILIMSFVGSMFPFYNSFFVKGFESSDNAELIATPILTLIMGCLLFLFYKAKLELAIDKYSIQYRFVPFVLSWKRIDREQIESAEVIKYHPIFDYGGWGYRIRPKSKALSVSGNRGVTIELKGKKRKLMIGTQKPAELEIALNKLMGRAYEE